MTSTTAFGQPVAVPTSMARGAKWLRLSRIEVFALVINLYGALLFLPGVQPVRPVIRAIPYVASLAFLMLYLKRPAHQKLPAGGKLVLLALILLAMNLANPLTTPVAGLAQCVFQLSIAAPVFWADRVVGSEMQLRRLLWVILLCNGLGASVGLLQTHYPEYFMPPEFSSLALARNEAAVTSLTYVGAGGREIVRPPGLSDIPGGAAISGMMAGLLGIALGLERNQRGFKRLLCLALAVIGMVTLYLTQVRSLFMMMLVALLALCILLIRQGRGVQTGWLLSVSTGLVLASFLWAISIGGDQVFSRFFNLAEEGVIYSYQAHRGHFVEHTVSELLTLYPLGAGLGRWGMMAVYFGRYDGPKLIPMHVEIQMTGWLLDGGVLMWLFYGGAVFAALWFAYRQAATSVRSDFAYLAAIVFSLNLLVAGSAMAGPVFNTQLGIQFWLATAALYGAARTKKMIEERAKGWDEPH